MTVKIKKIRDYLFRADCTELDYSSAIEYFSNNNDTSNIGACTSVHNGKYYGRNYDWLYDSTAEFVVFTPHTTSYKKTIGVAGGLTALTNDFVTAGTASELYEIVPFMLLDGMNENGLVASMNVVPTDKGETTSTTPNVETVDSINVLMIVRYIIDRFNTALSAAEYIRDYVSVTMPSGLHDRNYEVHVMIADRGSTYMLEFVEGETVIINLSNTPFSTNFYLTDVTLNDDNTVYTPATQGNGNDAMTTNGITAHGSGLERWNYIVENYTNANTYLGMKALMDGLKYTNTYDTTKEDFWYTEFVGIPYGTGQTTNVASDVETFEEYMTPYVEKFNIRSRDPLQEGYGTWQTVHSSIYDMTGKVLHLWVQEDDNGMYFYIGDMLTPIASTPVAGDSSNVLATTEFVKKELNDYATTAYVDRIHGHVIGEIVPVIGGTADYVPEGCIPADGTEYSKTQFPNLWDTYLTADTPLLITCSYADYATAISTYGQCAKWAVDTVNETFKVPTIKDGAFLQQAKSDSELGKAYNAGLPNITGRINYAMPINNNFTSLSMATAEGSFYVGEAVSSRPNLTASGSTNISNAGLEAIFNASRSSAIYGNSSTVQPNAVTVRYFVCVASGSVNQSMMDWSAYMSALNGKLDKSGGNITGALTIGNIPACIVEHGSNANGEYWVYSNDMVICTHKVNLLGIAIAEMASIFDTRSWTLPVSLSSFAKIITGVEARGVNADSRHIITEVSLASHGGTETPLGQSEKYQMVWNTGDSPSYVQPGDAVRGTTRSLVVASAQIELLAIGTI